MPNENSMLGPRSIAAEKPAPRGITNGHQNHFGSAITLDAQTVTPTALWECARSALDPAKHLKIKYSRQATERIEQATELLDTLIAAEKPVYGINTGFGHFAD